MPFGLFLICILVSFSYICADMILSTHVFEGLRSLLETLGGTN